MPLHEAQRLRRAEPDTLELALAKYASQSPWPHEARAGLKPHSSHHSMPVPHLPCHVLTVAGLAARRPSARDCDGLRHERHSVIFKISLILR